MNKCLRVDSNSHGYFDSVNKRWWIASMKASMATLRKRSTTSFMVLSVTCIIVSLYLVLRHMVGYTNDQQLQHLCHLITLGVHVLLLIPWHEYAQWCYEVYAYVAQWFVSWLKRTQMTLDINMFKNIFVFMLKCKHMSLAISMLKGILPLHTKTLNYSKYPNVLC